MRVFCPSIYGPCCSQRQASLATAFGCREHTGSRSRASREPQPLTGCGQVQPISLNLGTFWLQSSCRAVWGRGCPCTVGPSPVPSLLPETSLPRTPLHATLPLRVCFQGIRPGTHLHGSRWLPTGHAGAELNTVLLYKFIYIIYSYILYYIFNIVYINISYNVIYYILYI